MATRSLFILSKAEHNGNEKSDAVIVSKDKEVLGNCFYEDTPSGNKYLVCKLKKEYWIMSDTEKKDSDKYRRQERENVKMESTE